MCVAFQALEAYQSTYLNNTSVPNSTRPTLIKQTLQQPSSHPLQLNCVNEQKLMFWPLRCSNERVKSPQTPFIIIQTLLCLISIARDSLLFVADSRRKELFLDGY